MKINVVGTSGSGKSTVARHLAERLAIPYIEMDALFWQANWHESSDDEFFPRVEQALAAANWVLDGNYNRTQHLKWREVDWVVWVDYSFGRTLFQAVRRAWLRSWHREELWAGTGNRESFAKSFFSRDSIILWTLKTYRKNRHRYLEQMHNPDYRHIRFIQLRSPAQLESVLREIATAAEASKATAPTLAQ